MNDTGGLLVVRAERAADTAVRAGAISEEERQRWLGTIHAGRASGSFVAGLTFVEFQVSDEWAQIGANSTKANEHPFATDLPVLLVLSTSVPWLSVNPAVHAQRGRLNAAVLGSIKRKRDHRRNLQRAGHGLLVDDRADAGNRHHAKRDAGDEDVEAAQAAAQFAKDRDHPTDFVERRVQEEGTCWLGATTWRIVDINRNRVTVEPAPGEPGRLPFWKGEGVGRPYELGEAIEAHRRLSETARHYRFLTEAFGLFAHVNVLQRDMCPSATKFEGEIIAMASSGSRSGTGTERSRSASAWLRAISISS